MLKIQTDSFVINPNKDVPQFIENKLNTYRNENDFFQMLQTVVKPQESGFKLLMITYKIK